VAVTDTQDASVVVGGSSQRDESVSVSDSQASQLDAAAARAESVALTDAQSATGSFGVSQSESVALSDTQTGVVVATGTDYVGESFSLSDSQSAGYIGAGFLNDLIALADSYSASTAALPLTQRNLLRKNPLTRDRLRLIFGDHQAIKLFENISSFLNEQSTVDGDGKIFGALQRYGRDNESAAVGNDARFRRQAYNSSTAAQAIPATVRTYIDGSALSFPDGLQAGVQLYWAFTMSKTAAGVATSTFDIAFGASGSVSDVARVSFTKPAGTAAADEALVEVFCNLESAGVAGVAVATFKLAHDSTVGHATTPIVVRSGVSVPFDMTAVTVAGVCIKSGIADNITIVHCQAKAEALV
jgi:hypothetical protein